MFYLPNKSGANFGDFCDVIFFQRYMVTQPFPSTSWLATGQMGQHANERNFDIAMQHLQAAPFGSLKLGVDHEKHPPAPPKRCQYDPKGWLMGTPYNSFSTP